jgi:ureidoglycolate hydrolase
MLHETIQAKLMTPDNFSKFGKVIIPVKEKITFSNPFVDHYNDLGNLETLGENPVISYFSSYRRDFLIDTLERHRNTAEIFFPIEGTAFMPFAPTLPNGEPDVEHMEVFICREGHPFTAERGVWHLFPFPVTERYASYLLVDRNLIEKDLETFTISDPVRIAL